MRMIREVLVVGSLGLGSLFGDEKSVEKKVQPKIEVKDGEFGEGWGDGNGPGKIPKGMKKRGRKSDREIFTPLFNGKDFTGWWGLGTENPEKWMKLSPEKLAEKKKKSMESIHAHWKVVDGVIVNDGKGLYLTTEKHFEDFELKLEFKYAKGADSGIYLRGIPQVQIWDPKIGHKDAPKGSGGLWNNKKGSQGKDPLVFADKPIGEWNQIFVRLKGDIVTVVLNGKVVVDEAQMHNLFNKGGKIPKSGPIQLQTHGGEIQWKNVEIREL